MKRIAIFDFDNTLVNTAEVIKLHGYSYDFNCLKFYGGMSRLLEKRREAGFDIMLLSARRSSSFALVQSLLLDRFGSINLKLVDRHWQKFFVIRNLSRQYDHLVFYDDMFRGEEFGERVKLWYPFFFHLRNVCYVTHDSVLKMRGLSEN